MIPRPIRRTAAAAALIVSSLLLYPTSASCANAARDRSLEILNRWTSIRWGEENLAWVVYYPESLIDPWVSAEAERRRFRADQTAAYRAAFVDELRIDSTTPILLSVQVLGSKPVNLSPLADHIWLVDASGRKIRPMVIEKNLDGPLQGFAQGLIFFPKQASENFQIVVSGLVPERDTIFTFDGAASGETTILTAAGEPSRTISAPPEEEEVVVKIPTTSKPKPEPPKEPEKELEVGQEGETFQPTKPYVPEPEQPQQPQQPDYAEMPPLPRETFEEPRRETLPRMAPKQALEMYLRAWVSGNTERMYQMLSEESKSKISEELFSREVAGSSFRNLLKAGYKVTWTDEMTAKVTVSRKFLLMRSLESTTIRFVTEDGTARVSR